MAAFTTCNEYERSFSWIGSESLLAPGVGANVDLKAVVYFRDPATLKTLSFVYPSPNSSDMEDKPQGKRLKWLVVTDIVSNISTMSGISYVPLSGLVYQKN
jgi:hypothetical protein